MVESLNVSTFVIIVVLFISVLGLVGSLLRLRSQRRRAEIQQNLAKERLELQRRIDELKEFKE